MRLVILDPGHFHASLLQREMYPSIDPQVSVYAPLGGEVLDYLNRVWRFNSRAQSPTSWHLDLHLAPDFLPAMLRDRPGDIAVLTGRNRGKIDRILGCLEAGLHVLADKPWIISSRDLPKLETALRLAAERRLVAYDIMTERYEVTSQLQREFVGDPSILGELRQVRARSVHHIMKTVAGAPLRRPAWFFDIVEYGEGLSDVGTHVVDLVQWTAFPERAIPPADIEIRGARRWPLHLTAEQFTRVTGEPRPGPLDYYCNNSVEYTIRGVPVSLEIVWNWEAPPGMGDLYEASFQGALAAVEIRQPSALPELFIEPAGEAVHRKVAELQARWPGLAAEPSAHGVRIVIPDRFRVGHEQHFAQVAARFLEYVQAPETMPAWESPNMIAKYLVSTKGVEQGGSL